MNLPKQRYKILTGYYEDIQTELDMVVNEYGILNVVIISSNLSNNNAMIIVRITEYREPIKIQ